ncbi:hypothetical protein WDW37_02180 [Bdellovibrionota bacterium FG-1]
MTKKALHYSAPGFSILSLIIISACGGNSPTQPNPAPVNSSPPSAVPQVVEAPISTPAPVVTQPQSPSPIGILNLPLPEGAVELVGPNICTEKLSRLIDCTSVGTNLSFDTKSLDPAKFYKTTITPVIQGDCSGLVVELNLTFIANQNEASAKVFNPFLKKEEVFETPTLEPISAITIEDRRPELWRKLTAFKSTCRVSVGIQPNQAKGINHENPPSLPQL